MKILIFRGTFVFHTKLLHGKLFANIKSLYIDFTVKTEFWVRVHLKESLASVGVVRGLVATLERVIGIRRRRTR